MPEQLGSIAAGLDRPLVVFDVGARWGVFSAWSALGDKVELVGFEPDATECQRLNEVAPDNVRYEPVALGDRARRATLHLTENPACASLFAPRQVLVESAKDLRGMRAAGTLDVDLVPLDAWIAESGASTPDVMKLDTQGSELDILRGAEEALASVEMVEIEVELNPLYENQALFADIDRHLRANGFELWRIGPMAHYTADEVTSGRRNPLALYFSSQLSVAPGGSGQLFWADAYYIKSDFGIAGLRSLPHDRGIRAAAAALGLGQIDLAELILARLDPAVDVLPELFDAFGRPPELDGVVLDADVQLAAKDAELATLQQRILMLEASSSWRLTGPLRRVADRLRRRAS